MEVTQRWREYHSDYKELRGNGFIANLNPSLCVNDSPTEAFVGISKRKKPSVAELYVSSVAYVWDTERFEKRDSNAVLIYFFDGLGRALGGEEGGGQHHFSSDFSSEEKSKLIRILKDFVEFKPELACLAHSVIASLL